MVNFENLLKKYAELAVKVGVNIQKGQTLVLNSPIECADFARIVAEVAYNKGAKNVHVEWNDEKLDLVKFLNAPEEAIKEFPAWRANALVEMAEEGAAFLSIYAQDPEILKPVDPNRISEALKAKSIALKKYREYIMTNKVAWSIISIPTKAWSKKVFPEVSEKEAVEKLWENIFKIVRVDREDPIDAWKEHLIAVKKKVTILNDYKFKKLHYTSKETDLVIELPEKHLWVGCGEENSKGVEFVANIPTEEVFTLPARNGVNGKVKSTKPLNYGGNLIDNFTLVFKDGKIVDFIAEKGYQTLKKLIETDEGSGYLGEVALVPDNSPISNSNIIFFNTLFDENASCHLAIGKAYGSCLEGGEDMSEEELEKAGANNSLTHVDFMIGSKDLSIVGETNLGEKVQVFKNGNWAF